MIKEILSVFSKDSLLDQAYQDSFKMLELTQKMYLEAKNTLRFTESAEMSLDINDQDLMVNKYQREVRRDVFNHLNMTEDKGSLTSGLVLVSIVIDIERIGDHTKNIVEIAEAHPNKLSIEMFESKLSDIETAITDKFERTIKAFKETNEAEAEEILKEYKWVNGECDKIIEYLMLNNEPQENCGKAVAVGIYLRQLKRINARLKNVATCIVNPFDRIGYKVKKK